MSPPTTKPLYRITRIMPDVVRLSRGAKRSITLGPTAGYQGCSGFSASLDSSHALVSASPAGSQSASWISMNFLASAWQPTQTKISPV
jgi:hypothetical protein